MNQLLHSPGSIMRRAAVIMCWLLLSFSLQCQSKPTNSSDMDALRALYDSTGGSAGTWNYTAVRQCLNASNQLPFVGRPWNFAKNAGGAYIENPCPASASASASQPFMGVNCTCVAAACRISAILLPCGNLAGSIPPVLRRLSELDILVLSFNSLNGSLPSLGALSRLRLIGLHSNSLSGSLPNDIGALSQLVYLDLSSNSFTGQLLPSQIGALSQLTHLDLSFNSLSGVLSASGILSGGLMNIRELFVNSNSFSGPIPLVELEALAGLQSVNLGENPWDAGPIPASISQLSVRNLYLSNARLTGTIPPSIGLLKGQLQYLKLNGNALTGTLPQELGALSHLTTLHLDSNAFVGDLSVLSPLGKNLTSLYLNDNLFSSLGVLPQAFHNFSKLQLLQLGGNRFGPGPVPSEVGLLHQLLLLNVSYNAFSGSLPWQIGQLSLLKALIIDNNNFLGTSLPASLFQLKNMFSLSAANCGLSGTIPAELGLLHQLQSLQLGGNSLRGALPPALGNAVALSFLSLSHNMLTSTVPAEIANLVHLTSLLLEGNSFSGPLNFLSPSTQTRLSVVVTSSNAFTGTLPESVFALPALSVFITGSNCFASSLPANICSATGLQTLVLSGLNTGEACKNYYWKDTAFSNTFTAFGASLSGSMSGSIPQCIFRLPKLHVFHAAGNSFGGSVDGLQISNSLADIDVSRNRLTGSISSALAAQLTSSGSLLRLDMSFNRISGDLKVFDSIDGDGGGSGSIDGKRSLALNVNRLSGAIPASLLSVEHISILTGNLFGCSGDEGLPTHDTPAAKSYVCGSAGMDRMLYVYPAIFGLICGLVFLRSRSKWFSFYFGVMKIWLDAADGRIIINRKVPAKQMKRYSDFLRDLRWFTLVVGCALAVVLIIYLALSSQRYRTVEHAYTWMTTAAYLTTPTSAAWLVAISLGVTALTCYLFVENVWTASKNTDPASLAAVGEKRGEALADAAGNAAGAGAGVGAAAAAAAPVLEGLLHRCGHFWSWLLPRTYPTLRILVLLAVLWGVPVAVNLQYLKVLLTGTPSAQKSFQVFFAAFKLFWQIVFSPFLFTTKYLRFGLAEEVHDNFSNRWLGGSVNVKFIIQAVSNFFIPLFTIALTRTECFNGVLYAPAPSTSHFEYQTCSKFANVQGTCGTVATTLVQETIYSPFVYNYTCSSAIIAAYIPVYQQVFLLNIALTALSVAYFCLDINDSENAGPPQSARSCASRLTWALADCPRCIAALLTVNMPTKHLLDTCSNRARLHANGVIFANKPRIWILDAVPKHSSNLLILLTFGVMSPLLAVVVVSSIVLDTYVSQLVIGRFLVKELSVVQELLRDTAPAAFYASVADRPDELFVSQEKRRYIASDLKDAAEPWGAPAVLREVEEQCAHLPLATLSLNRTALLVIPAAVMAFLVNDVANSSSSGSATTGSTATITWPSALVFFLAVGVALLTDILLVLCVYRRCCSCCSPYNNNSSGGSSGGSKSGGGKSGDAALEEGSSRDATSSALRLHGLGAAPGGGAVTPQANEGQGHGQLRSIELSSRKEGRVSLAMERERDTFDLQGAGAGRESVAGVSFDQPNPMHGESVRFAPP